MGGDFAPANVVAGACLALRGAPGRFRIALVGPEDAIRASLAEFARQPGGFVPPEDSYTILHAPEVIDMHDAATAAVKT